VLSSKKKLPVKIYAVAVPHLSRALMLLSARISKSASLFRTMLRAERKLTLQRLGASSTLSKLPHKGSDWSACNSQVRASNAYSAPKTLLNYYLAAHGATRRQGVPQVKFAASLVSPEPLYFAT
jgi:hypothetical protein